MLMEWRQIQGFRRVLKLCRWAKHGSIESRYFSGFLSFIDAVANIQRKLI
ncbi:MULTISPECIES: hypothetical protein [Paenibacillus]|nr:hypothetical protein [Paenibacillus lautus]